MATQTKSTGNGDCRPTEEYCKLLDLADQARRVLVRTGAAGQAGNDSSLSKVLDEVPQIVVVGAQSAGKSSVLSRLSGILFPTNAERCTLVGTVLELRHSNEFQGEKVYLTGRDKNNDQIDEEFIEKDHGTITNAISAAQEKAVQLAGNAEGFVETLEIHIKVHRPDTLNLTLVDLPGLLASKHDSAGPDTVQRIVRKYADMKGSLLLFIVPVAQDYDTVLGKDIVEPLREKTTVVMTKIDKLDVNDAKSRLGKIVNETMEPRVIVRADLAEDPAEMHYFQSSMDIIAQFKTDIKIGCTKLGAILEEKMKEHLRSQMPKLHDTLVIQHREKKSQVDHLKPREKFEIMANIQRSLNARFVRIKSEREVVHQNLREELRLGIMQSSIAIDGPHEKLDIDNDDEFFEGSEVLVDLPHDDYLCPATIRSIKHSHVAVRVHKTSEDKNVSRDKLYSYRHTCAAVDKHIRESFEHGLRMVSLMDPQPVLEHFAKSWAESYGDILKTVVQKFHEHAEDIIKGLFLNDETILPEGMCALRQIHQHVALSIDQIHCKAKDCVARLIRYSEPPLVFSTNEHYFTSLYKGFVKTMDTGATDACSSELIYCKWLAYRKVQVKVIVEAAAKDLIGLYTIDFDGIVENALESCLTQDVVNKVDNEPSGRAKKRKIATDEEQDLKSILNLFEQIK